jgi:hypothetical protein
MEQFYIKDVKIYSIKWNKESNTKDVKIQFTNKDIRWINITIKLFNAIKLYIWE